MHNIHVGKTGFKKTPMYKHVKVYECRSPWHQYHNCLSCLNTCCKNTMDYSLFLNLEPMSLGQNLEYIARCVSVMPCVLRKGSKGSIGLTISSLWRQSRNVVCQLGSPFCHRPQLMLSL